jgi:AraC-like DNA-binding protein
VRSDLKNLVSAYGGGQQDSAWNVYDLFDHLKVGFPGLLDLERGEVRQPLKYAMHGWQIGSLGLVAGEHSALQAKGGFDHSGLSINLIFEGRHTIHQTELIDARPLEGAALLNGEPALVRTDHTNSLGIYFSPERLLRVAQIMLSEETPQINLRPRYVAFSCNMRRTVEQLPNFLAALKLYPNDAEDTIYRFLVRLLTDISPTKKSVSRRVANRESVDRVCAFMRAQIGEDLTMTDIEHIAGLSERNLQLAFKARFGCSPKVWLTRLRLELAFEALSRSGAAGEIREIANRFGFRHMGRFSHLFRIRFGVNPSALKIH